MAKQKLTAIENIVLIICLLVLATGFFLFYTNVPGFENFIKEDGTVEWLTVAGLVAGSVVCLSRFTRLLRKKTKWFLFVTLFLGLFLFFAAGEEISWGQRIFGLKTPAYFETHNAQQETNLHNLVVDGVKLNKLVFSLLMVIALAIYLVVIPILYQKNYAVNKFLDNSGVPIPRLYQVIGFGVVFIATSLIKHGKNAELLEACGASLFFLIMLMPKNKEIFRR